MLGLPPECLSGADSLAGFLIVGRIQHVPRCALRIAFQLDQTPALPAAIVTVNVVMVQANFVKQNMCCI